MVSHLDAVRELAVEAARVGGEILREGYGQVHQVRFKGEVDLVTEVDIRAERAITGLIRDRFPSHRILAEEGSVGGDDPAHRWIVDPLDGTTNYAHGVPVFCVSVGYELEGEIAAGAVYHPLVDELFVAEAGAGATINGRPLSVSGTTELKRSLLATGFPYDRALLPGALAQFDALSGQAQAVRLGGSAALDLCWVGAGRFDGYWERTVMPWDVAAGWLIATEAGARVTDLDGTPFGLETGNILACAPGIYAELFAALREAKAPVAKAASPQRSICSTPRPDSSVAITNEGIT